MRKYKSRKLMKAHIPLAIVGTTLILLHAGFMVKSLGSLLTYLHPKMISGYFALFILSLTLLGGYFRHRRASGFRRKFHLTMAIFFVLAFLVHMLLPL